MALIKFGSLITSGSGKLGGHTVQHSRGGFQLKTTGRPLHRPSASQLNIRSINHQIHSAWKSLTDNERKIWNQVAHPSLSGASLFYRYNYNYLSYGLPVVTDPYSYEKIVLGPELIDNPDFISSAGWVFLSGWSYSPGKVIVNSSDYSSMYQANKINLGFSYLVHVILKHVSGQIYVNFGGGDDKLPGFSSSGEFYRIYTCLSNSNSQVYFASYPAFIGEVYLFSLKQLL
jgi:hypothetical protein